MNIRDLKYLVSVARERHFAKAAQKSFVSQPTLSMQIKKLEDELGVQVFERSQKNFLVTKVGKEIIAKAEVILQQVDDIKTIAKSSRDPFSGELKIGAFPTLASYVFPKITPAITKKFNQLRLFLVEEKTEQLLSKLKSGEIDCALIALPIKDEELEVKKIFTEEFLLAVSKENPLGKDKKLEQKISTKDLKGKNLMLLDDGHCLRDQALEACSMLGAFEQQDFRASSLETLKQMVAINMGITFVPEIAANKNDKIIYLKISNAPKRSIGLVWRKSSSQKELIKQISEVILTIYG